MGILDRRDRAVWDFTGRHGRLSEPAWLIDRNRPVRINELVRKSVVFLGILHDGGGFAPYGTGFLCLWKHGDAYFTYLVTAKHVLDDMLATQRPLVGRINLKSSGEAQLGAIGTTHWQFHPTENSCDIAVCSFIASFDTFDVLGCDLSDAILTPEYIRENDVGCGDEVFTAGLLVNHFGRAKNIAIVRTGNIAAMTDEKIDLGRLGHQEAYLVESRSIGGLSGSPVFLHPPAIRIKNGNWTAMAGKRELLMGVHIGLFETRAHGDSVQSDPDDRRQSFLDTMSSGIGIVIPIQRVIEIIKGSTLFSKQMDDVMKKQSGFVPTSVMTNDERS